MSQQSKKENEGFFPVSGEPAGEASVDVAAGETPIGEPPPVEIQNERVGIGRHDQGGNLSNDPLVTVTENIVPGRGCVVTEFVARQVVHQYMTPEQRAGGGGGARNNGGHGRDGGEGRGTDSSRITR